MARFYGTVQGGRGQASRLGHPNSGLTTVAHSYTGRIRVDLFDRKGEDHCRITFENDRVWVRELYCGPVEALGDMKSLIKHHAEQALLAAE